MDCLSKNEIINELYMSSENDDLIKKLLSNNSSYDYNNFDEIKQDLFLILLEKEDELIEDLYKNKTLKYYLIRVLMSMVKSNNSYYTKTFKKYYRKNIDNTEFKYEIVVEQDEELSPKDNNIDDLENFDILKYCADNKLLTWYENEIMSLYYKMGRFASIDGKMTMRRIEDEYGIDHCAIYKTLRSINKKIKNSIK